MPRDSNGAYHPARDWEADAAARVPFSPARWNEQDRDYAVEMDKQRQDIAAITGTPAGLRIIADKADRTELLTKADLVNGKVPDSQLPDHAAHSTDALPEGASNLYFTSARVTAVIDQPLALKAPILHTHQIGDVQGLRAELDSKANTSALAQLTNTTALTALQVSIDLKQDKLNFKPVQVGGATTDTTSLIQLGWLGAQLALTVNTIAYGANWPINITGRAATVATVDWSIITGRPLAVSDLANDAGYIKDFRLGAETTTTDQTSSSSYIYPTRADAGFVITGFKQGDYNNTYNPSHGEIYSKPLQKLVNGTWITVSG